MVMNVFRKSFVIAFTVVFVCLAAAGYGCKEKQAEPGPNQVWLIGWNYIPDTLNVTVGSTVTWNNTTNDYHTVTSDDGTFNGRLGKGESFNHTFTAPGTYGYHDTATDPPTIGQIVVR